MRRLSSPLHRRADARRRGARRPAAEREGEARDGRRARRGGHERGRGARRSRAPTTRCSRGSSAERLDANISVKLTGLGLELDRGLCRENLEALVDDAAARGNFVRIDMEDSSTTDATLGLYRELRADGHENLGVVLQALPAPDARRRRGPRQRPALQGDLRRAAGDRLQRRRRDPRELRRGLDALLEQGAYVGIATHDE